jgi:hypothetical protein
MPDYAKTVIYKIEHVDDASLVYVGNTTNYSHRKNQHKSRSQNPNDAEFFSPKYVMIRQHGGWSKFLMKPIKEFPCKTKLQAEIEEEKCRVELKATLNQRASFSPRRQDGGSNWEARKEGIANYRVANSEAIQKYRNDKIFLKLKVTKAPEFYPPLSHALSDTQVTQSTTLLGQEQGDGTNSLERHVTFQGESSSAPVGGD